MTATKRSLSSDGSWHFWDDHDSHCRAARSWQRSFRIDRPKATLRGLSLQTHRRQSSNSRLTGLRSACVRGTNPSCYFGGALSLHRIEPDTAADPLRNRIAINARTIRLAPDGVTNAPAGCCNSGTRGSRAIRRFRRAEAWICMRRFDLGQCRYDVYIYDHCHRAGVTGRRT